jgi:hypothetical protein
MTEVPLRTGQVFDSMMAFRAKEPAPLSLSELRTREVYSRNLAHDGYNSGIEGVNEASLSVARGCKGEPIPLSDMGNQHNECAAPLRCRTGPLTTASRVYVETIHAWYGPGAPSMEYFPFYAKPCTLHNISAAECSRKVRICRIWACAETEY